MRNQQYRLVGNALYDMSKDPGQKTDLAAQHPEVVKQMRAAYDTFWKETRPLMVNEDVPMSKTRPFHVLYEAQMDSGGRLYIPSQFIIDGDVWGGSFWACLKLDILHPGSRWT